MFFVYLTCFRYYSHPYRDDENYDSSYGYNYRNYRSPVQDSSIKGKIEQKYWRGKQKVIEKLGKDQDEFVIAGDAEVDSRLEVITEVFRYLLVCFFYKPRGCPGPTLGLCWGDTINHLVLSLSLTRYPIIWGEGHQEHRNEFWVLRPGVADQLGTFLFWL